MAEDIAIIKSGCWRTNGDDEKKNPLDDHNMKRKRQLLYHSDSKIHTTEPPVKVALRKPREISVTPITEPIS